MMSVSVRVAVAALYLIFLSAQIALAGGTYAARTTLLKNREFSDALLEGVHSARKSIYFSFFLFKITDSRTNLPRRIAEELIQAKKRGVEVTVLLERQSADRTSAGRDSLDFDNRRTAELLNKGGVKVYFDSPGVTTHTKVAVIDGRFVFLGSHNLSQSALRHNNELSVMLDSPEMAAEVTAYLDRL